MARCWLPMTARSPSGGLATQESDLRVADTDFRQNVQNRANWKQSDGQFARRAGPQNRRVAADIRSFPITQPSGASLRNGRVLSLSIPRHPTLRRYGPTGLLHARVRLSVRGPTT